MKNNTVKTATSPSSAEPIAIVGIGCIFPQAAEKVAFWSNIRKGRDAITEVPASHWRSEDYYNPDPKAPDQVYAKMGGFLPDIDFHPMEYGILPNALEAVDTAQLLGLVAVEQALNDAGYSASAEYDRERVSVILGVTGSLELVIPLGARLGHPRWRAALKEAGVADAIAEDAIARISESYVPWQENSFPGLLGNVVAGRISKHFNFGGTNCVVDAACGSSLSALNLAALELATGKADMVVSGGVDTFNDIFMYTCFSKTPALSPSGHSRPFDADGDGTTLGEGLGVVVLKRLADAERDNDRIYAVIRGIGTSSDGRGAAIYEPSAAGQEKALRRAYQQAGVDPATIELVEAHGTGTKVGDAVEVKALRQVFGASERPWCALGSVKSQIGHTKAAAGSAGLIKATLALYHKILPPTIKVQKPQEVVVGNASPFYLTTEARPWIANPAHPRRAGVSALGFGGSNFHCLLEEYQGEKIVVDESGEVQIAAFSAADAAGLERLLRAFPASGTWPELRLAAGQSRSQFDAQQPCRLSLIFEKGKSYPPAQIKSALSMLAKAGTQTPWQTPDGVYFAAGAAGKLAVLFPGQGAQYPRMLADLALQFPDFFATLQAADASFATAVGTSGALAEAIYPRSSFDEAGRQAEVTRLQATEVAQPALGAVSLGAFKVMSSFGLKAAAFAGHSYGELTALCAGGYFDEPTLHRLSRLRGELMAAGEGDRGTMLAVSAPLAEVEKLLKEEKLDLVLANRNTPEQGVLSGATSEIAKAAKILTARGLRYKELTVAAAFHSPLVAAASAPFAAALAAVDFQPGHTPVFANSHGQAYPQDADGGRQLLATQLASPVEFVSEIENLYTSGIRTFVEVGPGARLTGMVKAILAGREVQILALDSSGGQRSALHDLARTLGQLAVLGYGLDLTLWDGDYGVEQAKIVKKKGMVVPLCGINYFKPPAKRPAMTPQSLLSPAAPLSSSLQSAVTAAAQSPVLPAAPAPAALQDALRLTQQSLQALQSLQEQTSRLHQQFLSGQENATRSFLALIEQQRQMLYGGSPVTGGLPAVAPVVPTPAPVAPLSPPVAPITAALVSAPIAVVPAAAPAVSSDRVSAILLGIVAEKTGYPLEMLELEMALDADLGIDSIKRVEILSALHEQLPEAPAVRPEHLGTLQTLGQIIDHLLAGLPAGSVAASAPSPASSAPESGLVAQTLLAVIAEKTGYPLEMLELEMALDADLGIDSIKRVEILSALQERLPEAPVIRPEHLGTLQTLGQIVAHLGNSVASTAVAPLAVAPTAAPAEARETVTHTLLAVIAEKTGYPLEMLELDMALDADLGIDSIKRVEIFAALQSELPNAPAVRPEQLGTLQTLGQIVTYLVAPVAAAPAPVESKGEQLDRSTVAQTLLAVIADKTGYPLEMLELEMALDADLGIDSIKRVEILSALQERLPAAPAIRPEHLGTLQTVGQIVDFLASVAGAPPAVAPSAPADAARADGEGVDRQLLKAIPLPAAGKREALSFPTGAVIGVTDDGSALAQAVGAELISRHLTPHLIPLRHASAFSLPSHVAGLIVIAPAAGTDDLFLRHAFELLQGAAVSLQGNPVASFLTVSRLNGYFGLQPGGEICDPLSGGLAGLSKTAGHEWPQVQCKALDLAADLAEEAAAKAIVDELLLSGPIEVGISAQGLHSLKLTSAPLVEDVTKLPLQRGDLVVISGGARGVTAAVAIDLAQATQATMLLLGRSPLPQEEPAWLSGLQNEAEIKKALISHSATPLKPKEVGEQYQTLLANREISSNLQRMRSAGSEIHYLSVDLRDNAAVAGAIDTFRRSHGPVKGLIHGAGVLADRLIKDKTIEQFDLVYSTKVLGLRSLLAAVAEDALTFLALFSSSTGRFGRTGQVDYAVANEVLNKIAQSEARLRPSCRVVSLNWGPWDGGMVTPALKKLFAAEGVGVISLRSGSAYLLQELATQPGGAVELVILGASGEVAAETGDAPRENIYVSKAFDLDLSIEHFPFLKSHVIDQKAVLPLAMIVEWLGHGAIHNNPGLRFHGFNDLRVLKGVILAPGQSHNLQVMTGKAFKSGDFHVVPVELSGTSANGQHFIHARAKIVLANRLPERKSAIERPELALYPHAIEAIYAPERLFHGVAFQGLREVIGCGSDGIAALSRPAPLPQQWIEQPLRNSWLADPLVIDASFQMMILWSFERYNAASLPVFAGRYRQYSESFPDCGAEIRIHVSRQSPNKATAEIDFVDPLSGQLLARLEDYECVIDASLNESFQRNTLQGVAGA